MRLNTKDQRTASTTTRGAHYSQSLYYRRWQSGAAAIASRSEHIGIAGVAYITPLAGRAISRQLPMTLPHSWRNPLFIIKDRMLTLHFTTTCNSSRVGYHQVLAVIKVPDTAMAQCMSLTEVCTDISKCTMTLTHAASSWS